MLWGMKWGAGWPESSAELGAVYIGLVVLVHTVMWSPSHSIPLPGCHVRRRTLEMPLLAHLHPACWGRGPLSLLQAVGTGHLVILGEPQSTFSWHLSHSRSVGLSFWLGLFCDSLVSLHILSKLLYNCWSTNCFIRGLSLWVLHVVSLHV